MFRRKSAATRAMRHDERLAALGALLDDRHFVLDAAMTQGFQTQLVQQTLEITKPMLDEAFARR